MFYGFSEAEINILESVNIPNTYWSNKSEAYQYWFRSLLHKIDSALVFKNLPKGWNNDYFMLCLWCLGFVAVFPSNREDLKQYGPEVLFARCTLAGKDFYYQPKEVVIANPYYEATLTLGKEAELLKLTPDFRGCLDIIDHYSTLLAEASKGLIMGLINAKTPMILSAKNYAQNETLRKVYDLVQKGQSLVVYDNTDDSNEVIPTKEPFEAWTNDFSKTYIVHSLLEDMEKILDSFYKEIGLPVANEKKERLITDEAEIATAQSQARISCWYETITECLEKINKHFNLKIGVSYACKINTDSDRKLSE